MGAQRIRYVVSALSIAIVLSLVADRLTATRGDNLAAAADLKGWPAAPLAVTVPTSPLTFTAVTPCRVADTRGNGFTGQYGPPSIGGGGVRTFTIGGQCGIPAGAAAVSFNFTILDMSTAGDIRVFPAGAATPLVSTQNWNASTAAIANAAATPLGTGGAVTVQIDGLGGVNLIIDVNGYYAAPLNFITLGPTDFALAKRDGTALACSLPSINCGLPTNNVVTNLYLTFKIPGPANMTRVNCRVNDSDVTNDLTMGVWNNSVLIATVSTSGAPGLTNIEWVGTTTITTAARGPAIHLTFPATTTAFFIYWCWAEYTPQ